METTRKGTSIIYENGLPVEINTNFVDTLCKSQPGKYSKTEPGKGKDAAKTGKDNLKLVGDSEPGEPEDNKLPEAPIPPQGTDADGKFTVEDLMQLEYKELQDLAKKLNSKGAKINPGDKKKVLAKKIFEESNK